MNLLINPPIGARLVVGYTAIMSLLQFGGIILLPWIWILLPLLILIVILLAAFILGLIVGVKGHEKRVKFWEAFYSRKPDGDKEEFTKWL